MIFEKVWILWLARGGLVLAGTLAGYLIYRLLVRKAGQQRNNRIFLRSLLAHSRHSGAFLIIVSTLLVCLPFAMLTGFPAEAVRKGLTVLWFVAFGWVASTLASVLEDFLMDRFDISAADNLLARRLHTRFRIFRRVYVVVVWFVSLAGVLMLFERFRAFGTSLFASAGIAGLIVGLSAQKTISSVIAGVQIALSQPINIDDVVIVEGEWGRVEEITFTYVVIRIWDQRRLIVPVSYFLEKPFQNWTRVSADIIGSVFVHADYRLPAQAVREEVQRLCEASPELWDGRVCALHVTDAKKDTVEFRAIMSAADASKAWDLRCRVREKLIEFVRDNYPECLPRLRVSVQAQGESNVGEGR